MPTKRHEMKKQTEVERQEVMVRELDRVDREIARQKRTGKKRSIPWIVTDLDSGEVTAPPGVLRVVK